MPQENVEIVRRMLEAWHRDDLDTWLSILDPAMEWHTAERMVEGSESVYRGIEGMRELWIAYRTELKDFQVVTQELRDLEDGRVLLLGQVRWRGAASGIEISSPTGLVLSVRGGKVIRSMDYLSHQEALDAVGLHAGAG